MVNLLVIQMLILNLFFDGYPMGYNGQIETIMQCTIYYMYKWPENAQCMICIALQLHYKWI